MWDLVGFVTGFKSVAKLVLLPCCWSPLTGAVRALSPPCGDGSIPVDGSAQSASPAAAGSRLSLVFQPVKVTAAVSAKQRRK